MFTDAEKVEIESMMDEPFDAFKEQIAIYKTPTVTFVSTDQNYNFIYGQDQPNVQSTYQVRSGMFDATIEYLDNIAENLITFPTDNSPITVPRMYVRLSVKDDTAKDYLREAEKVIIDGDNFSKLSARRPRGMFTRHYDEYYFQKID